MPDNVHQAPDNQRRGEAGQAIVLLAASALFFVGLMVVVGDSSLVWWQSRSLQNTADAAALAGAQELNGTAASEGPAIAAAQEWVDKNIADLSAPPQIEVTDGFTRIRVTVQKNSGALFGGLNLGDPVVTRTAVARIASVDILPCVVPFGVQKSFYDQAVSTGGLAELKLAIQGGGSGTSNTGLLNLAPGNSAGPIQNGSCNTLTDPVTTKPGATIGDVNNGLRARLQNAMANDCYTEAEVMANLGRCKPGVHAGENQATAVMLLPVLDTDIVESGAKQYPLATIDGTTFHLLAHFWVDGNSTYVNPANGQWQCVDGQNKCVIRGKFVENVLANLSVWQGGDVADFNPDALIKIVQLVE